MLNHNMIRGPLGVDIIEVIAQHQSLSNLELQGNFLGLKSTPDGEAPASILSKLLLQSRLIEKIDLGYN